MHAFCLRCAHPSPRVCRVSYFGTLRLSGIHVLGGDFSTFSYLFFFGLFDFPRPVRWRNLKDEKNLFVCAIQFRGQGFPPTGPSSHRNLLVGIGSGHSCLTTKKAAQVALNFQRIPQEIVRAVPRQSSGYSLRQHKGPQKSHGVIPPWSISNRYSLSPHSTQSGIRHVVCGVPARHMRPHRCVAHITQTQTSCPLKCGLWWDRRQFPGALPDMCGWNPHTHWL